MANSSKYSMADSSKRRATFATVHITRLTWRFKTRAFSKQILFSARVSQFLCSFGRSFPDGSGVYVTAPALRSASWSTRGIWDMTRRWSLLSKIRTCSYSMVCTKGSTSSPGSPWLFPRPIIYTELSFTPFQTAKETPSTPVTMRLSNNSLESNLTAIISAQIVQLLIFPLKCLL